MPASGWKLKRLKIYNHKCEECKLHKTAEDVCFPGYGNKKARIMVVSRMPNSGQYRKIIEDALSEVGIDLTEVFFTAAVKCRTFDQTASTTDVKKCRDLYLEAEIAQIQPEWVLAFGNEALLATTGHSGITKYRAKVIEKNGYRVIPTISPAAITRNPGQRASWYADIAFFAGQVLGKSAKLEPPRIHYINTLERYKKLKRWLKRATLISYDIETNGFDEFKPDSAIVSLAGTLEIDGKVVVWALPLWHPQSPFRSNWQRVLKQLAPLLERIPKQVAHNGKFDARWLRHYGVQARVTFDTMLACHLLNENQLKGLKPQATARFGVADWAISTKDLASQEIMNVLEYNALDTFYTYHIYLETKAELVEKPRLLRIFVKIIMPANELFIEAERRGIWIDREKLATNTKIAFDMRDEIDRKLMEHVPEPDPSIGWPTQGRSGRPVEVNFNPSNFARWWLFDHLELPIIRRGKDKADDSPGDPSMAEDVMLELRGVHPVVELLLDRSKWQKYCSSFLTTYDELADENDRIHTTFKLAGTVTGRLSSGKADDEKITARTNIRGVNVQQIPRDPFIRGLFGAAPGYAFVEVDFSQVELRVVAFLSRDRTMLRLYQTGQDIHRATAAWVLGVPPDAVSKDDRKKAKAVNFGFVYGMGAPKFVSTAFEKYQVVFTIEESRAIRKRFFENFSGLFPWHARQRRLVHEYGRVQSPLGRVRNLPDVFSQEDGVRAEAERQAINSPVQSFASDCNLIAMIETARIFKEQGIEGYILGTVHDATLFEVRVDDLRRALPIIKDTFENLPLKPRFGIEVDVPIVADLKVGTHWGGAQELEVDEVYDWNGIIAREI